MASEVIDFVLRHKFVILFYLAVVLFVLLKRKKIQFQLKFIALYRTNWGIKLMDSLALRYRELIKLFGYVSIGIGFTGMVFIVVILVRSVFTLFTVPDAPPAITPILPGVRVPGVPESLFIPLVQGIIAIFIVAVIHEFSHGVVARAHNIPVKSTGIALIGPFFAAFVEPDEKFLKKKSDVVNYSMVAAGPVSNIFSFVAIFALLSLVLFPVVNSVYDEKIGFSFSSVTGGAPADVAGLETDVVYDTVNGQPVLSVDEFLGVFDGVEPGERVTIGNSEVSHVIVTGANPNDEASAYLGVTLYSRVRGDGTFAYSAIFWVLRLLSLTGILSLGIGLANLLPIGPIDGGKMLQQALHKLRGEHRGNKTLLRISLLLLFVIILLMSPIFRETAKAVVG